MPINHSSIEPYILLLQSMETDLRKVEEEASDGDQYRNVVQVIVLGIRELGKLIAGGFTKEEEDIAVFCETLLFDAMSLRYDYQLATITNPAAALALLLKKNFGFHQRDYPEVGQRADKTRGWRFEWRESKSAAVEWIKAVALSESVYVNGVPATTVQLVTKFEDDYGMDLRDFNKLLYVADTRKKDATPYLTKLINAFKERKVMLRK